MITKSKVLVSRDSKNKLRMVVLNLIWIEEFQIFTIQRLTGQYQGKMSEQATIEISKGKAKRTIKEQAELEYNSHLKKYLDKGYKDIVDYKLTPDMLKTTDLNKIVPLVKTDQSGATKPMLAKLYESVSESTLNKIPEWYISRKVDGVRALIFYKDGVIKTASRGGGDYDYATKHIIENQQLINFFKKNPFIVLDGELYIHGVSLQNLSGCARLTEGTLPFKLQYYIYDIVDLDKNFYERYKILQKVKQELNLDFNPSKVFNNSELYIQMLPQILVSNDKSKLMTLHDQYVQEGWEGAVLRDPSKKYNPGARDMYKIKCRKDSEYKIVGYELGLRGVEDLVFVMTTVDGKQFKAKPMGSREVKDSLYKNINSLIGKMATCTYFYLSDDGIPLQPVWKAVRDKIDM